MGREQPLRNETKAPENLKSTAKDTPTLALAMPTTTVPEIGIVSSVAVVPSSKPSDGLQKITPTTDMAEPTSLTKSSDHPSSQLTSDRAEIPTPHTTLEQTLSSRSSNEPSSSLHETPTAGRTSSVATSTSSLYTPTSNLLSVESSRFVQSPTASSIARSSGRSTSVLSSIETSSYTSTSAAPATTIASSPPSSSFLSTASSRYSSSSTESSRVASSSIALLSSATTVATSSDVSSFMTTSNSVLGHSISAPLTLSHASQTSEQPVIIQSSSAQTPRSTTQQATPETKDQSTSMTSTSKEIVHTSTLSILQSTTSTPAITFAVASPVDLPSASSEVPSVRTFTSQSPRSTQVASSTVTDSRSSVLSSLPLLSSRTSASMTGVASSTSSRQAIQSTATAGNMPESRSSILPTASLPLLNSQFSTSMLVVASSTPNKQAIQSTATSGSMLESRSSVLATATLPSLSSQITSSRAFITSLISNSESSRSTTTTTTTTTTTVSSINISSESWVFFTPSPSTDSQSTQSTTPITTAMSNSKLPQSIATPSPVMKNSESLASAATSIPFLDSHSIKPSATVASSTSGSQSISLMVTTTNTTPNSQSTAASASTSESLHLASSATVNSAASGTQPNSSSLSVTMRSTPTLSASSVLVFNGLPSQAISSTSTNAGESSFSRSLASTARTTDLSALNSVTWIPLNQTTVVLSAPTMTASTTPLSDMVHASSGVPATSLAISTFVSGFPSSVLSSQATAFFSMTNSTSLKPTALALPTRISSDVSPTQSQDSRTNSLSSPTMSTFDNSPSAKSTQASATSASASEPNDVSATSMTTAPESVVYSSITPYHVGNSATKTAILAFTSSPTSTSTAAPVAAAPLTQAQRAGVAVGGTTAVLIAVVLVIFVGRRLWTNHEAKRKSTGSIYPKSTYLYNPVREGRGGRGPEDGDGGAMAMMSGGAGEFAPRQPQNTPDPTQRYSSGATHRYSDPGNPFRDPEDPFRDPRNPGQQMQSLARDSMVVPVDAAAAFAAAVNGYAPAAEHSPYTSAFPAHEYLHDITVPSPALSPFLANQNGYHSHVRSPGLQPSYYQPSMRGGMSTPTRFDEPFEYDLLLGVVSQKDTPDSVLVYAPPSTPTINRPDSTNSVISHPERFSLAYDYSSSTTYLRAASRDPSSPRPTDPFASPVLTPPPPAVSPTYIGWDDIRRQSGEKRTPSRAITPPPLNLAPLPLSFPPPPSVKISHLQLRRKEPALAGQGQVMAPNDTIQPLTVKVPPKFEAPKQALLEKLNKMDEEENGALSPATESVYSRDSFLQNRMTQRITTSHGTFI